MPTSVSYAENQRVEKLIELAGRAKEKTEILINMTYLNQTAMDAIEYEGLLGELEANVTLFNEAAYNITVYHDVANLTLALGVFREVYKSVNRILAATPEVQRGQLVDAQGLLQAMTRALDRIERLREIGELPDEAIEAMSYLNITQAILDLQDGMVEETVYNLTQANKLISEAHKALKKTAAEMNTHRIRNYVKVMNNFCERLGRQVEKLEDSPKKEELQKTLGDVADLVTGAETVDELEVARNMLEGVEQGLKEQRRAEKGNGKGNGNGNGSG